jgi:hypothetical protein
MEETGLRLEATCTTAVNQERNEPTVTTSRETSAGLLIDSLMLSQREISQPALESSSQFHLSSLYILKF